MTSRKLLFLIAALIAAMIALEITGLVPGAGRSSLPFLVLLGAAILVRRAVSPDTAATTETTLAIPLEGATSARLDITFGAGDFHLGAANGDSLLGGQCTGALKQQVQREAAQTRILLGQPMSLVRSRADWQLVLTTAVTWDRLKLMLGASEATLDLRDLDVVELILETGGTMLDIHLPQLGRVTLRISGGESMLHIPAGVPAIVTSKIKLGEVAVDEAHFAMTEDDKRWTTHDLSASGFVDDTADALHIDLKGGMGTVRVVVG